MQKPIVRQHPQPLPLPLMLLSTVFALYFTVSVGVLFTSAPDTVPLYPPEGETHLFIGNIGNVSATALCDTQGVRLEGVFGSLSFALDPYVRLQELHAADVSVRLSGTHYPLDYGIAVLEPERQSGRFEIFLEGAEGLLVNGYWHCP